MTLTEALAHLQELHVERATLALYLKTMHPVRDGAAYDLVALRIADIDGELAELRHRAEERAARSPKEIGSPVPPAGKIEPVQMPEPPPEPTLAAFMGRHSEDLRSESTALWTYRFGARGHDVLVLMASGPDAAEIMTEAAMAAGVAEPGLEETVH